MKAPTELRVRYRDLETGVRYQFVLDAANVVRTVNATVQARDARPEWPLMLELDNGEALFTTEDECRTIRGLCPDCDSAFFTDRGTICADCAWVRESVEVL